MNGGGMGKRRSKEMKGSEMMRMRVVLINVTKLTLLALVMALFGQQSLAKDVDVNDIHGLVGTKIEPEKAATPGKVPGMKYVDSGMFAKDLTTGESLSVHVGFIREVPVFSLVQTSADSTRLILDIEILPTQELEWKLKGDKVVYVSGYRFSMNCREHKNKRNKNGAASWVLGLVKPEIGKKDCSHFSSRVLKAWRVDKKDKNVNSVLPDNLQCEYLSMDSCY